MGEWMHKLVNGLAGGWMSEEGWMGEELMDAWTDGWMNGERYG